jgi:hypothetical protein
MILQERKSKYKTKITIPLSTHGISDHKEVEMRKWCENLYGPGGRRERWRYGWTQKDITFYFRQPRDAMMFSLKWN